MTEVGKLFILKCYINLAIIIQGPIQETWIGYTKIYLILWYSNLILIYWINLKYENYLLKLTNAVMILMCLLFVGKHSKTGYSQKAAQGI